MDEEELLRLVHLAVPSHDLLVVALEAAVAAHGLVTIDAALAELVEDSAAFPTVSRSDARRRTLVYEHPDGVADITISGGALVVDVDPPASIVLERPDGGRETLAAEPVESLERTPRRGAVRLRIGDPEGWVTGWFTL